MTTGGFPRHLNDIDIEESQYLEDLKIQLEKSDLYVKFSKVIKTLRHVLHNKSLQFENSAEQSFGKEVIYRTLEESFAYLSNIRQGVFFAAIGFMPIVG